MRFFMKKISWSIILCVLFICLSFAITMQLKISSRSESKVSKQTASDKLKDEIFNLSNQNNKLKEKLQISQDNLTKARDEAAENNVSSVDISQLINEYSMLNGDIDVKGEGIILKYIPQKDEGKADITKDLRDIVNELKNAGAEAISINDERIVVTSAIEMVKNKIEINEKEIISPFVIRAIGNSELINSSLIRPGGTVDNIRYAGIKVDISTQENVEIKKYSEI